jgi:hypothetical protein
MKSGAEMKPAAFMLLAILLLTSCGDRAAQQRGMHPADTTQLPVIVPDTSAVSMPVVPMDTSKSNMPVVKQPDSIQPK